jgi:hypothetical protein
MSASEFPVHEQLLPTRIVAMRFAVVIRTIDRWLLDDKLKFPRPVVINNHRYFKLSEIEIWERARVAKTSPLPIKSRLSPRAAAAAPSTP